MIATLRITRLQASGSRHQADARSLKPVACSLSPVASPRRGVSLLEVLIAIFVLTFGLMSIAMVIPAGRALMVDASKSDRATACGRAGLNEVRIRGWYDPTPLEQKWGPGAFTLEARPALIGTPYTQPKGLYPGVPGTIAWDNFSPPIPGLVYGEVYFLDPYFFVYENNELKESIRHFPYSAYPEFEFPFAAGALTRQWPEKARARRVAFRTIHGTFPSGARRDPKLTHIINEAFAERITTWADELIFSLEDDNQRPRQMVTWFDIDPVNPGAPPTTASVNAAAPSLPSDNANLPANSSPQRPTDEGRFTWSVMITPIVPLEYNGTFPIPYDVDGDGSSPDQVGRVDPNLIGRWDHDNDSNTPSIPLVNPARITRYEVSIVVFYRRTKYCPEGSGDTTVDELRSFPDVEAVRERSVFAQLVGAGIGGGDVLLFVPDGDPARPADYLRVKKNDWIMLKGLDRDGFVGNWGGALTPDFPNHPHNTAMNNTCMPTYPTVCRWYRVVSVDDVVPVPAFFNPTDRNNPLQGRGRTVTLAGPDWQVDTTPFDPGFNWQTDIAEAALVDDVVGVYTTIIDINSL